jgi:ribosomal protein S18 acetylase RimI-like enzyme
LTEAELDYFWRRGYRPEAIRSDMVQGMVYEWIAAEGRTVGFVAYRAETGLRRLHLSKLYLAPGYQGLGIGGSVLSRLKALATRLALDEIYLYVFRSNARAIRAYQKAGFGIARTELTECESGFRYDDYVMTCPVTKGAEGGRTG